MKKHKLLYFVLLIILTSCSMNEKFEVANYKGNATIFTSLHSNNIQISDTSYFFESQRCLVYLFPDIDSVQFGELDIVDLNINNRVSFQLYLSPSVIKKLLNDRNRKMYLGRELCSNIVDTIYYSKVYISYKNHYPVLITEDGLDYSVNKDLCVNLHVKECISYMLLCNNKEDCSISVKVR